MGRSTVHYADGETNNVLKRLHNKLRPAGTPVERVEYIIELLLLRIFEAKLKQDEVFVPVRKLFEGDNYRLLFSHLLSLNGEQILSELNKSIFPFYASIISRARDVVSGNLPQKMQDQLVLMEEVFANSNFTNNVKGGVIAEVIGLVNEIDEKWILKTDLLGDAIESALSETGGTKDLGLYRTPDHIRNMMVQLVDPDFTDTIFDPACGTAGFLFDAYEYVIAKAKRTRDFPAENVATQFYRSGIGGIEYQGRIRKMAAVNMYIRGLNPHNIEQGDSLKLFDPARDANSKSVVISNPPFGAERDQPAYPNIWEEYSRESETTILFVKLMFDLLKQSGRCAVVVSEGLLSWGQSSACSLRRLLINEANLRAIISLPQGVFVSKGGQGAKTSILYFEKGQPTTFTWYYRIENDGFSMGTNRKPIAGSQIPEVLEVFPELKKGRRPDDSRHGFCVSREQIETLDPRVAERIRLEVRTKTQEKTAKKREALIKELRSKVAKGNVAEGVLEDRLGRLDNTVEGRIDNEVAKAIEKAHTYDLNMRNYRSALDAEKILLWHQITDGVKPKDSSTIDQKYQELLGANPSSGLAVLAAFDPADALHLDLARSYLDTLGHGTLQTNSVLKRLDELLRVGVRYPMVKLGDILERVDGERVGSRSLPVLSITMHHGLVDQSEKFTRRIASADLSGYKVVKNSELVVGFPIDEGVLGFQRVYDEAAVSPAYGVWKLRNGIGVEVNYLEYLLRSNAARNLYKSKMIAGAGRRRSIPTDIFLDIQIPVPTNDIQNEIAEKVERLEQIIEGADKVEENWVIEMPGATAAASKVELGALVKESLYGTSRKADYQDHGYPVLRIGNIGFCGFELGDLKRVNLGPDEYQKLRLHHGDFLIVRSNGNPDLVGKCAVWNGDADYVYASYLIRFVFDTGRVEPRFVMYYLMSPEGRALLTPKQGGGTYNINSEEFKKVPIPLPSLDEQRQLLGNLDSQMRALDGLRALKHESRVRIEEILTGVWGESLLAGPASQLPNAGMSPGGRRDVVSRGEA